MVKVSINKNILTIIFTKSEDISLDPNKQGSLAETDERVKAFVKENLKNGWISQEKVIFVLDQKIDQYPIENLPYHLQEAIENISTITICYFSKQVKTAYLVWDEYIHQDSLKNLYIFKTEQLSTSNNPIYRKRTIEIFKNDKCVINVIVSNQARVSVSNTEPKVVKSVTDAPWNLINMSGIKEHWYRRSREEKPNTRGL